MARNFLLRVRLRHEVECFQGRATVEKEEKKNLNLGWNLKSFLLIAFRVLWLTRLTKALNVKFASRTVQDLKLMSGGKRIEAFCEFISKLPESFDRKAFSEKGDKLD